MCVAISLSQSKSTKTLKKAHSLWLFQLSSCKKLKVKFLMYTL